MGSTTGTGPRTEPTARAAAGRYCERRWRDHEYLSAQFAGTRDDADARAIATRDEYLIIADFVHPPGPVTSLARGNQIGREVVAPIAVDMIADDPASMRACAVVANPSNPDPAPVATMPAGTKPGIEHGTGFADIAILRGERMSGQIEHAPNAGHH